MTCHNTTKLVLHADFHLSLTRRCMVCETKKSPFGVFRKIGLKKRHLYTFFRRPLSPTGFGFTYV